MNKLVKILVALASIAIIIFVGLQVYNQFFLTEEAQTQDEVVVEDDSNDTVEKNSEIEDDDLDSIETSFDDDEYDVDFIDMSSDDENDPNKDLISPQADQSVIPYVNETFGFSLEFPRSWEGFRAEEEYNIDDGIFLITFVLPLSNQEEMSVFTIEAYYEELPELEMIYSKPLANNNAYYLYYSHFNGDAPVDLDNVMKFEEIIKTIEIFDVEVG